MSWKFWQRWLPPRESAEKRLADALRLAEIQRAGHAVLVRQLGELEAQRQKEAANAHVTLLCVLMAVGGEITLDRELMEAVGQGGLDYRLAWDEENNATLALVTAPADPSDEDEVALAGDVGPLGAEN